MHQFARQVSPDSQLLFLPGVFNESLSLLFEAQQYFQVRGVEDQAGVAPGGRLFYANEMSRITLRLTSAIAWLMVRRAVYAGRIDEAQACDEYRLNGAETCVDPEPEMMQQMPYYLTYLSDRSRNLYERIQRLDAMAYDDMEY